MVLKTCQIFFRVVQNIYLHPMHTNKQQTNEEKCLVFLFLCPESVACNAILLKHPVLRWTELCM